MNKRECGSEQEKKAAGYLKEQGYEILQRNYYCRFAELDIVARGMDGYLCFIEVKYRKNRRYGAPEGVVSYQKQRKICQGARFYMKEKRIPEETPIRFDVIVIIGDEIQLIQDAFDFIL